MDREKPEGEPITEAGGQGTVISEGQMDLFTGDVARENFCKALEEELDHELNANYFLQQLQSMLPREEMEKLAEMNSRIIALRDNAQGITEQKESDRLLAFGNRYRQERLFLDEIKRLAETIKSGTLRDTDGYSFIADEIEHLKKKRGESVVALLELYKTYKAETDRVVEKAFEAGTREGIRRAEERQAKAKEETLAREAELTQKAPKKPSKRKQAEETAITALPDNVALITAKHHAHAFTPVKNPTAYIQQLQADYIDTLIFDNETGRIQFKGENFHEEVTLQKLSTRQAVKELDLPLLRSLYTVIYNNAEMIRGGEVSVYVPTLCRHLDIDIQTGKPAELFKKIIAFKDVVGVMGKSFYKMLEFSSYENETNIITFSSPYMNKILRALQNNPSYKVQIGKTGGFLKPAYSFLIHGSIYKERNKPAIEIAISLVTLLQQRGEAKRFTKKDKKVAVERLPDTTAHIKFSTLIKGIPLLAQTIQEQGTTADKNRIIKRAFTGGFELLRTQTNVYRYFLNLKIPDYVPTTTQLNRNLDITHDGINPDYKE